jgi:hypothetical protein
MRLTTASILAVAAIVLRPSTTAADSFDEALALVPKDVAGAFVVPNLKKASDDLDACLERVDRAEALLVGRPLDLLKAQLGASVGVRDDGALVGFLRWPAGQAEPTTTLLVPVTDAEAFLRGSFELDGAGQTPAAAGGADRAGGASGARTVRRRDGTSFWALPLHVGAEPTRRTWVALSPERPGVAGLAAEAGAVEGHRALLAAGSGAGSGAGAGASGERLLQHADLLAWIDGATIRRLAADRAALAAASMEPQGRAAAERAAAKADELLAGVRVAATTWNVDALGLFGRGVIRIDPASQLGSLFAGAADATEARDGTQDRFDRLPDQPFYAAVGIDVQGLGGPAAIKALEAIGLPEQLPGAADALGALSRWSDGVREAQLAIFPSKLGITVGGILNDAALALRTRDPATLRDRIQAAMESLVGDRAGVLRSLSWERDKQIKESGTADAFELKESPSPTQPRDVDLQSALIKGSGPRQPRLAWLDEALRRLQRAGRDVQPAPRRLAPCVRRRHGRRGAAGSKRHDRRDARVRNRGPRCGVRPRADAAREARAAGGQDLPRRRRPGACARRWHGADLRGARSVTGPARRRVGDPLCDRRTGNRPSEAQPTRASSRPRPRPIAAPHAASSCHSAASRSPALSRLLSPTRR